MFDGYFFEKNLQGDIVAVYNQDGVKVAGYIYDAWGSCTTTYYNGGANTAVQYNPFRYRGYYYDAETGLYYLQSRYYDPAWGRFISADAYVSTGQGLLGFNMYAYCGNNPVDRIDSEGQFWLTIILATPVLTAVTVMLSSCEANNSSKTDSSSDSDYSWADNDPILSVGRHKTYEEVIDCAIDEMYGYAQTHKSLYNYVVNNKIPSYVIDVKGNAYVLPIIARNYMDYKKLR